MAAILWESVITVVVVILRTRPRAMPLAMVTARKSFLGGPPRRRSSAINYILYTNTKIY